jgi:hypothetical protein
MKSPFAQPEKSRVANVTIAKSRVLAAQVLRILSTKGFGKAKPIANPITASKPLSDTRKERPTFLGVKFARTPECGAQQSVDSTDTTVSKLRVFADKEDLRKAIMLAAAYEIIERLIR